MLNTAAVYIMSDLLGRYIESQGGDYTAGVVTSFLLLSPIIAAGENIIPITRSVTHTLATYFDPETTVVGNMAQTAYNLFDLALKTSALPLLYVLAISEAKGDCLSDDPAIQHLGWWFAARGVLALAEERGDPSRQKDLRVYRHLVSHAPADEMPTIGSFLSSRKAPPSSFYIRDFLEHLAGGAAVAGSAGLVFPGTWGFVFASQIDCETGEPNPASDLDAFQDAARISSAWAMASVGVFASQTPSIYRLGRRFGTHIYDALALRDPWVGLVTVTGTGITALAGIMAGDRVDSITSSMGTLSSSEPFVKGVEATFTEQLPILFATVCTEDESNAPLYGPAAAALSPALASEFEGSYETALAAHAFYPPTIKDIFRTAGTLAAMTLTAPYVIESGKRLITLFYRGSDRERLRTLSAIDILISGGINLVPPKSTSRDISFTNPMATTAPKEMERV